MKEQLIEFETAELAKDKGFNCDSMNVFHHSGEYTMTSNSFFRDNGSSFLYNEKGFLEAPTQSLLQKWLREEHKIDILIEPGYYYVIYNIYKYERDDGTIATGHDVLNINDGEFTSHEEALEKGLQEALKLIK